jgi:hypothetical protein
MHICPSSHYNAISPHGGAQTTMPCHGCETYSYLWCLTEEIKKTKMMAAITTTVYSKEKLYVTQAIF